MQSTNRTFYLFTVVCTCVCVYMRVDSLLETRLQEGPLEVDNDIQAVLKEVWPHVACRSCPFYEARTTVFHCRSAIIRTTPRMFPTGRLSSVKALVIFKFSSLYCVHSGTYTVSRRIDDGEHAWPASWLLVCDQVQVVNRLIFLFNAHYTRVRVRCLHFSICKSLNGRWCLLWTNGMYGASDAVILCN